MTDYLALKNGTDVRGTALETENGAPVDLTGYAASRIAAAFYLWAKARTGKEKLTVAVGHDPRLTAEMLVGAVTEGIISFGGDVVLTGLSSTPSMFMLLQDGFGADASVMITASHLPKEKNGLKFFMKEGGLEGSEVKEILEIAAAPMLRFGPKGRVTERAYIGQYAAALVQKVRAATGCETPLAGKKILVDAGNGAGGFYVDLVLKPLGADTAGSQFLDPDGNFPNHIPNPENEEAMASVCAAVKANGADLGIIFDTDVDRAGAVGPDGKEINRNRLIALISAILLEEEPNAVIVTDSVTSDGLTSFIEARGGLHLRFKRGYKNVINEAKRLNAEGMYSPLAIETSGHAALKENYFLDDGAYLVTRLIIALAQKGDLESLIADLPEPAEAAEVRLKFLCADFKEAGARILEELGAAAKAEGESEAPRFLPAPENYEGVRLNFNAGNGDGWALVRMSLHEPILPINMESNTAGGVKKIAAILYDLLKEYDFLDTDKLLHA